MNITLVQAEAAIKAAKAKATELNLLMNISLVDSGANLVAFARMDGAWLGSVDISFKKAKTSAWFFMNSGDLGTLSQPGGSLYNIEHSNGGLITFPGGIPIKDEDGKTIGAIGVSGSTVENDLKVAQAGADAVAKENSKKK
ncbi:MAG TPA: heme-binding protein [Chryseolinea sp.]|nr:heme-binding protein [Chryseolinea sp.]